MASVWLAEISTISNIEQNVSYIEQMFQIVNKSRYDSQPNKLYELFTQINDTIAALNGVFHTSWYDAPFQIYDS